MDSIHELKQMNTYLFNRAVFFCFFLGSDKISSFTPPDRSKPSQSSERSLSTRVQGEKKISDPCFFLGYDPDS